jgi:GT2 family glycosyltransferase
MADLRDVGVVVIGRNEGARLESCFASLRGFGSVLYVDSGSSDGSLQKARRHGLDAIGLDASQPLSAARARNAGRQHLRQVAPSLAFVQFLDGDCELEPGWLEHARAALSGDPTLAVAAGRLREKHPHQSVFHRVADVEWHGAGIGEVADVGGVFMVRCRAFDEAGGFDANVGAGEEPELCHRLRARGWRIVRLAAPMACHDLGAFGFVQWWRRAARFGYASSDLALRRGMRRFRRHMLRAWLWSAVPAAAAATAMSGWSLAAIPLSALWVAQALRVAVHALRSGCGAGTAASYACLLMVSYGGQLQGQIQYFWDRGSRRRYRLFETKARSVVGGERRT